MDGAIIAGAAVIGIAIVLGLLIAGLAIKEGLMEIARSIRATKRRDGGGE